MRFIIKGLFFLVEPRAQNLAVLCCSRVTPVSLQNSELNDYLSSWVQSRRKIWKFGGQPVLCGLLMEQVLLLICSKSRGSNVPSCPPSSTGPDGYKALHHWSACSIESSAFNDSCSWYHKTTVTNFPGWHLLDFLCYTKN